jgi:DNA-directed RNA polymerase subunit M/transcription elongation factor TFIIS
MSSIFCKICNNLLAYITTADESYFKCNKCQQIYQPEEKDSLRYEDSGAEPIYGVILKYAGQDPVNPKVYAKCEKCNNEIAKQVRIGSDMKLINVCTKCNFQWSVNQIANTSNT